MARLKAMLLIKNITSVRFQNIWTTYVRKETYRNYVFKSADYKKHTKEYGFLIFLVVQAHDEHQMQKVSVLTELIVCQQLKRP